MKRFATAILLTASLGAGLVPVGASAASCAEQAQAAAGRTGGEIINVTSGQDGNQKTCTITLRLPGKDGQPPRVVTRIVKQ